MSPAPGARPPQALRAARPAGAGPWACPLFQPHLLLLTATPHNGDDGAWQSLVGLLDNRLGQLTSDLSGADREDDRKLLARFLIQRQRADIREYLSEDTPFPSRKTAEESYKLTPEYRRLFDHVLAYAREQVTDPSPNHIHRRVRWWSAIALLRSIASSPAAAEQTLRNRSDLKDAESTEVADAVAGPRVFDVDLDDTGEGEDTTLGADTSGDQNADVYARRRLRAFANEAAALRGVRGDAKLKRAIAIINALVADGYHPIIFCRYIPTADYLAEHLTVALAKSHPTAQVEAVTGNLPPEEREARVRDLTVHDGPRVLVATDCLSEGVNLQEGFTAVLHYDLAWNPTRHEQREGRVDRFGQVAPTVRTVTYYGADNKIDGVVLDVLIRRHEAIKRSTGVSVPVPVDSATVMNAIWESLLLRGADPDRICRDNGITHRLTQPRSPTTTGKIERFHGSLRRELLDDAVPFTDLATAQAAIDAWVNEYNTARPHQALAMATPAERFSTAAAQAEQDLLPLRLPAVIALAAAPAASTPQADLAERPAEPPVPPAVRVYDGGPVEFERVVPASGNMQVARRQFWLGPDRSGTTVTFWASTEVIHLLIAGTRVKTVRSHLSAADLTALAATGARPAGPPPLPPAEPGAAIEVDRIVSKDGAVHLASRYVLAAEILGGRRVSIRSKRAP